MTKQNQKNCFVGIKDITDFPLSKYNLHENIFLMEPKSFCHVNVLEHKVFFPSLSF